MGERPSVRIETLLQQRGWVRGLARSLVLDESRADDLEQQAWVDALRSPPREDRGLRGWFASVLRRRARDAWREGDRRARREEAAARPEAARSTADVVADAEAHRRVVEAVMALEEPYRETVLLRFFEELPPREVAKRTNAPVETVRTRTRRALERLRERLDQGHGGGRAAWMAAVAPLAGLRWESGAALASGSTVTAGIAGGATMASKATVAVGVMGAVAGSIVGGLAAGSLAPSGNPADLETARAEVRELRGRLEAVEAASAAAPRRDDRRTAEFDERIAAQERRIAALVTAEARAASAGDGAERDREAHEASAAERKAKSEVPRQVLEIQKAVDAAQEKEKEDARRKFLDASTPEAERASLLTKLRDLRGLDQEVARVVGEIFRASTSPAVREKLLRDSHGTRLPELKALFLEALRSDPDELVRDRAARDIDDYFDDPEVVKALENAKEGDASKLVRDRAARRLRDRDLEGERKKDD